MLYLIKLNIILTLLCLLFQVVMHRDTFFGVRRAMLWGIYLTALVLPLCDMQLWMQSQSLTTHLASDYATYVLPTMEVTAMRVASMGYEPSEPGCGMWFVGTMAIWALLYLIPVVWMTAKLLWQIAYIIYLRCTCRPTPLPLPYREGSYYQSRAEDANPQIHSTPPLQGRLGSLEQPLNVSAAPQRGASPHSRRGQAGGGSPFYYPRPCSPFSFGPWIFIHSDGMDEQTLREIFIHEQAHVHGWHTLDIIVSQLFCILFWWNPATWIMRREVRLNLEFIADKAVADSLSPSLGEGTRVGRSLQAYQYRLLGFSTQTNVATIANNFNVLPLKRRIVMMNLRRTRRTGMLKYILFVPVAAALLLLSNLDALARKIDDKVKKPVAIVIRQDTQAEAQPDKQPLIVVNGSVYEGDVKAIDPETIDHVDVLKDKTATDLWGSRGANGVIVITTKDKVSSAPMDAKEKALSIEDSKLLELQVIAPSSPHGEGVEVRMGADAMDGESPQPLIIVNGSVYEGDVKAIDPETIDHIEVLKDKAATDLWGSRGANGVIQITTKNAEKADGDTRVIYDKVDEMPEFPGGAEAMYRFLMENVKYPAIAQEIGIQGKVIVQFVVQADGWISDVQTEKLLSANSLTEIVKMTHKKDMTEEEIKAVNAQNNAHESLKREAVRVISCMPRWKPGKKDGKPVNVRFSLPISFRLR